MGYPGGCQKCFLGLWLPLLHGRAPPVNGRHAVSWALVLLRHTPRAELLSRECWPHTGCSWRLFSEASLEGAQTEAVLDVGRSSTPACFITSQQRRAVTYLLTPRILQCAMEILRKYMQGAEWETSQGCWMLEKLLQGQSDDPPPTSPISEPLPGHLPQGGHRFKDSAPWTLSYMALQGLPVLVGSWLPSPFASALPVCGCLLDFQNATLCTSLEAPVPASGIFPLASVAHGSGSNSLLLWVAQPSPTGKNFTDTPYLIPQSPWGLLGKDLALCLLLQWGSGSAVGSVTCMRLLCLAPLPGHWGGEGWQRVNCTTV